MLKSKHNILFIRAILNSKPKEVTIILYEKMLKESQKLETQINSLCSQLHSFPDGNLIWSHTGKYTKWYHSDGKNKIYIPKKNRQLAEALATKKYLTLLLDDLLSEKQAIDSYLKHHSPHNKSEQLLTKTPEYQELLSPIFLPTSHIIQNWIDSPYEKNPLYPDQLVHRTGSGNFVRSKSESIIDTLLYTNKIPFRYECALHIGDATFFPDFTIYHPRTQQIFYWEHFGMMDNPVYCQKAYSKLQFYTANGIIPTHQLITTFETKNNPLDSEYAQHLIEHHFLN